LARSFLTGALRKQAEQYPALLRTVWRIEAVLLGAFDQASGKLSPDRASALGRRIMRTVGPHLDKTRHFRRNFSLAFPEKDPAQIDALVRGAWGNLGAVLAEYPHLGTITHTEAAQRCQVVIDHDLEVFKGRGRPAIFVEAHLGNWEVAPPVAVRRGVPLDVLYTPLQNPWLDRRLRHRREALGCGLINRYEAPRRMVRQLSRGGSIGLLTDQRVDSGELVPLFSIDMYTTTAPARLALRFGCELIPTRVERLTGAHFRISFHEPVRPEPGTRDENEKALQMTRQLNALYEDWIRARPHEWMCSNRRWPKDAQAPPPRGRHDPGT